MENVMWQKGKILFYFFVYSKYFFLCVVLKVRLSLDFVMRPNVFNVFKLP